MSRSEGTSSATFPSASSPSAMDQALAAYRDRLRQLESVRDRAQRLQLLLSATEGLADLPLCDRLSLNVRTLELVFQSCADWVLREFRITGGRDAAVTYLEGIVDRVTLEKIGLKSLMYDGFPVRISGGADEGRQPEEVHRLLEAHVLPAAEVRTVHTVREVADHVLHGDAVIMVDGETSALVVNQRKFEHRSVNEPEVESVVRGPREGFVESLRTNSALVRRRIRTPELKMEHYRIGRLTRTDVLVAYVRGLAAEETVEEVRSRLSRIDIDGILDSGYLEELIEDDPYSPFPQLLVTERPDTVAAGLLEGRIAILVDGSPGVLVVPIGFWGLMEASEDWYARFHIAMALRALRFFLAFLALLAPALYVAALTYHQEMLPTTLLLTVAATREGIPFPSLVEALIMEVLFEALREAGVRLPKVVGQAVSIVGALVIGQAAVQAGIVSAPMVIIVAVTGIASFTFPRFNLAIAVRLLRFPLIFLAGMFGLYGIMIGMLLILIHLAGLRSFGLPYLSPLSPLNWRDAVRVILRPPVWIRRRRPWLLADENRRRQKAGLKAGPAQWEGDRGGASRGSEKEGGSGERGESGGGRGD